MGVVRDLRGRGIRHVPVSVGCWGGKSQRWEKGEQGDGAHDGELG